MSNTDSINSNFTNDIPPLPLRTSLTSICLITPGQISISIQSRPPQSYFYLSINSTAPLSIQDISAGVDPQQSGVSEHEESLDYWVGSHGAMLNHYIGSTQSVSALAQDFTSVSVTDPRTNLMVPNIQYQNPVPTNEYSQSNQDASGTMATPEIKPILPTFKKKRNRMSLKEKVEIIISHQAELMTPSQLSRRFKKPRTTILGIIKGRDNILKQYYTSTHH
ncbi:hypothetical protein BGZ76_011834 [Entomortierella beljakovae]|nr:hypothetical protein BGZ76_011834 [Entomortierella beljakovae]